jgi:hypothetical protein
MKLITFDSSSGDEPFFSPSATTRATMTPTDKIV